MKKEKTTQEPTATVKKAKAIHEEPVTAAPAPKAQSAKPVKKAKVLKPVKADKAEAKESTSAQPKKEQPQKKAKPVKAVKAIRPEKSGQTEKMIRQPEKQQAAVAVPVAAGKQTAEGSLTVRLPKTLRKSLEARRQEEEVSLDQLVTYLIMRGLSH